MTSSAAGAPSMTSSFDGTPSSTPSGGGLSTVGSGGAGGMPRRLCALPESLISRVLPEATTSGPASNSPGLLRRSPSAECHNPRRRDSGGRAGRVHLQGRRLMLRVLASRVMVALLAVGALLVAAPVASAGTFNHNPILFVHGIEGSGGQFESQNMRFMSNGYPAGWFDQVDYNSTRAVADKTEATSRSTTRSRRSRSAPAARRSTSRPTRWARR